MGWELMGKAEGSRGLGLQGWDPGGAGEPAQGRQELPRPVTLVALPVCRLSSACGAQGTCGQNIHQTQFYRYRSETEILVPSSPCSADLLHPQPATLGAPAEVVRSTAAARRVLLPLAALIAVTATSGAFVAGEWHGGGREWGGYGAVG